MPDNKYSFTTDEEFEMLEDRDATTSIVGYVDAISAHGPAGKNQESLFKFILTNGTKKIFILIWGDVLIRKYFKEICCSRIIYINGGYCKAVIQSRFSESSNFVPYEIIIKPNTWVSFLGYYMLANSISNEYCKTDFNGIHTVEGLVEISGYIRTKFSMTQNRNGLMTYGIGEITDGVKKITVQVKSFIESHLQIGDNVTVRGTVEGQVADSLITIFCDSMDDIKFNQDVDPLSEHATIRGGRPVKRIRDDNRK